MAFPITTLIWLDLSEYLAELFIFEDTVRDETRKIYTADEAWHIVNNELMKEKLLQKY